MARAIFFRIDARGLAAVLQAVTLVLLARQLGPSDFGVFGQAQSIGIIGAAVFSFGFSSKALRLSAEDNPFGIVSGMFIIRMLSAVLVVFLVSVIFYSSNAASLNVLLAVGSVLFADMLNELTQGVLSGLQRQSLASVMLIVHRLLPFIAVIFKPLPESSILVQFAAGCALSALAAVAYPLTCWVRPVNLKSLTSGLGGFWLSTMAGPLSQLDTTIIRLTTSVTFTGYYAAAARVGAPLNLISSSLVNIAVPAMSNETEESARVTIFLRLRRVVVLLALFIFVLSPFLAELIVFFLGEQYRPGWLIFCGVILGAALSGVSQMYQAYFFAINRPRVAARCISVGTISGLAVLGVSSSYWGVVGLALGPIAMQATIVSLFIASFRKCSNRL